MQLSRLGWWWFAFFFSSLVGDFWKLPLPLSETSLFLASLFPLARCYGWGSCSQRNWAACSVKMKKACLVGGQEQDEAAEVARRWSKGRGSRVCQWEEHTHPLQTQNCLTKECYGTFWHPLGLISSLDGAPCGRMPTGLAPAQAMVLSTLLLLSSKNK